MNAEAACKSRKTDRTSGLEPRSKARRRELNRSPVGLQVNTAESDTACMCMRGKSENKCNGEEQGMLSKSVRRQAAHGFETAWILTSSPPLKKTPSTESGGGWSIYNWLKNHRNCNRTYASKWGVTGHDTGSKRKRNTKIQKCVF